MDGLQTATGVARLVMQDGVSEPVGETRGKLLDLAVAALEALSCATPKSGPARSSASTSTGIYCGSFWPSPSMVATMTPRAAQHAGTHRSALPGGSLVPDLPHRTDGAVAARAPRRLVGRAVIDDDQFEVSSRHRGLDLVDQQRQVRRLVPAGNDDGYHAMIQNSRAAFDKGAASISPLVEGGHRLMPGGGKLVPLRGGPGGNGAARCRSQPPATERY